MDYEMLLGHIMRMLPNNQLSHIVGDFERALWQAVRSIRPDVTIKGCLFHFNQAIIRKAKAIGLQRAYMEDPGTTSVSLLYYIFC